MSESHEVFPAIPSDQFRALKTKTYQIIVKKNGIIYQV